MYSKRALLVGTFVGLSGLVLSVPALFAAGKASGRYVGNGKEAKLAFVTAVPHEDWDGQKAYTLILSERDASRAEKPDFDAMFGELGDALVISVTQGGDIFSVQVCHQALEKAGFSTSGTVQAEGFQITGNRLSARFFTTEEQEFFGDRWSLDLKVEVDLP
jgi:hypothetical protein